MARQQDPALRQYRCNPGHTERYDVRTALCPGSFDPIHLGHLEVIETAAKLFDRLVVAVIRNPGKGEPLFTFEERVEILQEVLAHLDNVEITMMKKLTVDVC